MGASGEERDDTQESAIDLEAAWRSEVIERIRLFAAGETAMLDGDDVYQQLRAQYAL